MNVEGLAVPLASAFAAVLALTGVLVTALVRRRKPVEVTDLWAENRQRAIDNATLRTEFDEFRDIVNEKLADRDRKINTLGDGFDAAMTLNSMLLGALQVAGITVPVLTASLQRRIDAARAVRDGTDQGAATT